MFYMPKYLQVFLQVKRSALKSLESTCVTMRHICSVNRGSLQKSKVSAVHPSAVSVTEGQIGNCAELDIALSVILTEHMLRSELYLVLEGKCKNTFDQFMTQLMILVYAFMLYI